MSFSLSARAVGLAVGFALDRALGDPRRGHPVAAFGALATSLESVVYADTRRAGATYTTLLVGSVGAAGWLAQRRRGRLAEAALVAAATYTVLGGTSLVREGDAMATLLEAGDLSGARQRLSHLCARDPAALDADDLARATVESIAENTSDAVVAPLWWGAVVGVPGLLGYRAANTLDAMVGYRSPRHLRFGWTAARLDDLLNLLPARLAALLTVLLALPTGSAGAALQAWRRDARRHPSPNAGPVEAAFAGALGVRLGGANVYHGEVEERGILGDGRPVSVPDVRRANALSRRVGLVALGVCLGGLAAAGRLRRN